MHWSYRLFVLWTVAAAVHLPMPIGDGDDLKSGQSRTVTATQRPGWDIDFILLGCDPPDDCDDGPIDDDPENGMGSPFGSCWVHVEIKSFGLSKRGTSVPAQPLCARRLICGFRPLSTRRASGHFPRPRFSFGKSCQEGVAVMRC